MFVPLQLTEDSLAALDRLDQKGRVDLVRSCVHAIIILGQNKTPIKRTDLNRLAFPGQRSVYKVQHAIIQEANIELNKTFGMRLYELEDKTKFLLINSNSDYSEFHQEPTDSTDERATEEELQNSLSPLNLTYDAFKEHLDSFVKKLYLTIERKQDRRSYLWGPRAIAEVEPETFFHRFLELMGDNSSESDFPDLKKRVDDLKSLPFR